LSMNMQQHTVNTAEGQSWFSVQGICLNSERGTHGLIPNNSEQKSEILIDHLPCVTVIVLHVACPFSRIHTHYKLQSLVEKCIYISNPKFIS
jgi:hypothetical protein